MAKMDPKVKKLWLKALPKYTQGFGRLCVRAGEVMCRPGSGVVKVTKDHHCCLGVLSEVAVAQGIGKTYLKGKSTPSQKVRKWAKLGIGAELLLVALNDDDGRSFKQIAKWIERNL